jgi:DnaA family protein
MSAQLPLALRWPAQQRFDAFIAGDNAATLAVFKHAAVVADAPWVFASGPAGSGKTHLLIAACAEATARGHGAQYLPLTRLGDGRADALRALGGSELLALDDVGAIAGDAAAEIALFDLYNRSRAEKATLLFAAPAPPAQLDIRLPDLVSRLSACTQAVLKPLDDAARRAAVRQRAQLRGLELDEPVLDWLFAHSPRDLGSLTTLIERLDRESLAAQRRITLPFLRQLLRDET